MITTYADFLERVIDEGVKAAKRDYIRPAQRTKLEGSIEGFEACRGKAPAELSALLDGARRRTEEARNRFHLGETAIGEYWRVRCKEAEIEWTCNVVSVLLMSNGEPVIVPPTARAAVMAGTILEEGRR